MNDARHSYLVVCTTVVGCENQPGTKSLECERCPHYDECVDGGNTEWIRRRR